MTKRIVLLIAFCCFGLACFAGGYMVGGWIGWDQGYNYALKTIYYKANGVQIASF